jgi:CreA protein
MFDSSHDPRSDRTQPRRPIQARAAALHRGASPGAPAAHQHRLVQRLAASGLMAAAGIALIALLAAGPGAAHAVESDAIGEVDTVFKWIGPDHKIVVDAYDDPGVQGVTCYVSRAKTGGVKGALGLAEDKSEASIACRAVGPVSFPKPLPRKEEVFSERRSLVFKRLRVVRMVDPKRNTLVYLTYSDRVIEGSPQNSVTAVPVDRGTPIPLK